MDGLIIANWLRPTGLRRRQGTRYETEYYLRYGPRPARTIPAFAAALAAATLGGLAGFLPMVL